VRSERFALADENDAAALAGRVRGLVPAPASVHDTVAEIIAAVREEGDAALDRYTRRFDTKRRKPPPLRVSADALSAALAALADDVRAGLQTAIANVAEVAAAGVGEAHEVNLPEGHTIVVRELPVRRAAVYVPGGRAPYPSTVVMGVVTARAAGVEAVAVCTPPGADATVDQTVLAACSLCAVDEVYAMGGAQAIAALAYGTETVQPVDVIVGPGNLYVQDAKRQVSADVGIDGFAGPSDLLVIVDAEDEGSRRLVALDLLAQAEHGPESLVIAVSHSAATLDAVAAQVQALAPQRPTAQGAACVLVDAPSLDAALAFSEAYAPEHLELVGPGAETLAGRVRSAGCVFVGWPGATAFGDYVAGSNHVLPTGGSARFASVLSPSHFRRRMNEVRIGSAVEQLARAGAPLAWAEGFAVHAESMAARAPAYARDLRDNPSST
jgi:histidinol dehydrogenase